MNGSYEVKSGCEDREEGRRVRGGGGYSNLCAKYTNNEDELIGTSS